MLLVHLTDAEAISDAFVSGFGATQGAVEVDLNVTVFGQMILFVALWLVLKPVLFDPMIKLFEEREKRIDGAKLKARAIDTTSLEAEKKYDAAMAKVRAEASAERDRLRADGAKAEAQVLATVRAETAKTLEEGRVRLTEEAAKVRAALREEAPLIANEMAARALGREVRS